MYHLLDLPYIQSFEEINSVDKFVLTLSHGDISKLSTTKNKAMNFFEAWKEKNLEINDILHFSPEYFI